MSITQIYGVRVVAGVSLFSALATMMISSYIFTTRLDDLATSTFPTSGVPQNISFWSNGNIKENAEYEKLILTINEQWIKYRPVLVICSGLAAVAGLLQSTFSILVLLADTKFIRLYVRKWMTVHFVLVFVHFIIILNTVVLTEQSSDKNDWENSINRFKAILLKERPLNDYSALFRFLGVNQLVLYICVGIDLAMILILMGTMLEIMRRFQDYNQLYD